MRSVLIATVVAAGIGLVGTSGAFAAPANGLVIDEAATTNQLTQQMYHRRWHRGHRRCFHRRHISRVRCWR
jgi:hypothetical protein